MRSGSLFDRDPDSPDVLLPQDSHVVEPAEVRRLAGQNLRLLLRLREGPATRRELTAIALNPTARVSDLRKAGYDIRVTERRESGWSIYVLCAEPTKRQVG